MLKRIKNVGPGALVAAAFIGPGTVTACTLAGANYGYVLLWALMFATLATIVLQEMSARLGLVTQQGLAQNLRDLLQHSWWRWPLLLLIIVALYAGNAAYEAGNLAGASLGLNAIVQSHDSLFQNTVLLISGLAAVLLWFGSYPYIEKILLSLVVLMALAFITTFVLVKPDLWALFQGLFSPQIPAGSLLTVIALIGTTIVPYNLFLHASAVKAKWHSVHDLKAARTDTAVSIGLGGLITILIAATAAASMFSHQLPVSGLADMALQLEPVFGAFSATMLGLGLFAAGLSSALTAPLATAYAMTEILALNAKPGTLVFRLMALSVILVGATLALTGIKPLTIIVAAQFANGLLLPVIALFLLYAMNQKSLLGQYTNSWLINLSGLAVVLITAGLGLRMILKAVGYW